MLGLSQHSQRSGTAFDVPIDQLLGTALIDINGETLPGTRAKMMRLKCHVQCSGSPGTSFLVLPSSTSPGPASAAVVDTGAEPLPKSPSQAGSLTAEASGVVGRSFTGCSCSHRFRRHKVGTSPASADTKLAHLPMGALPLTWPCILLGLSLRRRLWSLFRTSLGQDDFELLARGARPRMRAASEPPARCPRLFRGHPGL